MDVVAQGGAFHEQVLARAALSRASQIRARIWSFDAAEPIDDAFFKRRVAQAIARRNALPELAALKALRLIHAESDGLPGLVADRYGDCIVMQITSTGAEKWHERIAASLLAQCGCRMLFNRSDSELRTLEGMAPRCGWLGAAPEADGQDAQECWIEENGLHFSVPVQTGHKTGFYLDQRDNRALLRTLCPGRRVLDCYCYSGGFALNALMGGAREILALDSSEAALDLARGNLARNAAAHGLEPSRLTWMKAHVPEALRAFNRAGERFDCIILDPPKFAPSAQHAASAARAYKDINMQAMKLLTPGGMLLTFSCSGGVGIELFQKIIAGAALDAGRTARIVRRLSAGADHPVLLTFPEGEYLKGLLLQVE